MQIRFVLSFLVLFACDLQGQLTVTEVGTLIESVSNNAVCEGFIAQSPYLFSFGGIDSTKRFSGIHQRSFRYNIETGESISIPSLPDGRGKIASAASRIGNIIYITGGYYVNSNGTEESSDKLHRYDILSNEYLSDGSPIPVPTDDHVQVVWQDSLLYLITGWNDSTNIPDVQIYNPSNDTWLEGEAVPNINNDYKSFGASGVILKDTIFYFGGAASIFGFPIQNDLRKGVIDPSDPTQINWSVSTPDPLIVGYRMAATTVGTELHWIGGSERTYNFDGIAYNGTGGVATANRDLFSTDGKVWEEEIVELLPMDLRGIAVINDTLQYLAGGMIENQRVTNKVYKLEWKGKISSNEDLADNKVPYLFPVPFTDRLFLSDMTASSLLEVDIYNAVGRLLGTKRFLDGQLDMSGFPDGVYHIQVREGESKWIQKVVKVQGR